MHVHSASGSGKLRARNPTDSPQAAELYSDAKALKDRLRVSEGLREFKAGCASCAACRSLSLDLVRFRSRVTERHMIWDPVLEACYNIPLAVHRGKPW